MKEWLQAIRQWINTPTLPSREQIKNGLIIIVISIVLFSNFQHRMSQGNAFGNDKVSIIGGVIKEHTRYFKPTKENVKAPYLDYREITTYSKEASGRYANVTPDGRVRWDQDQEFEESPQIVAFYDQITLNGKAIHLPMSFADLGPEYADFDMLDFETVGEKKPVRYHNLINDYVLKNASNPSYEEIPMDVEKDRKDLFCVWVAKDGREKKIRCIDTEVTSSSVDTYDLRIGEIGVGSTFNEMYEVLGRPTKVSYFRHSDYNYAVDVNYSFKDEQRRMRYWILFTYWRIIDPSLINPWRHIKDNVIVEVIILKKEY